MSNVTKYKITILSSKFTWLNQYIPDLIERLKPHDVRWIHEICDMNEGEICFIISFNRLLTQDHLVRHKHNIVIHESDLPKGKGMSPLSWQILEGKNKIPITLFEAAQSVDAGEIYLQDYLVFEGHELVDELRHKQAMKTFEMCLEFVKKYPNIASEGKKQVGQSTYYDCRTPADSKLDIDKTIRNQFNLLRIVDNNNYPAFFDMGDYRYVLKIEKQLVNACVMESDI
jgi:methionyl-tRNA formyltransferase